MNQKENSVFKIFAFGIISVYLLVSAVVPLQLILARPAEGEGPDSLTNEPPTEAADDSDEAVLSIHAKYANGTEISGILIQIFSGETKIFSGETPFDTGYTPVNFTLPRGQVFTVLANSTDNTFFYRWNDSIVAEMARVETIGQVDSLTAVFLDSPGALISVNARASVLDSEGKDYPLSLADSSIQYSFAQRFLIIDSGPYPRTYELEDGRMYKINALDPDEELKGNFNFSYWIDPATKEKFSNETLLFEAEDGLELHAFYEQADSRKDFIFLDSKLENGTTFSNAYVKILKANAEPSDPPAAQDFTPTTLTIGTNEDYIAVASDCGICLDEKIVFDHWEASGGPSINTTVLADEYPLSTDSVANRTDILVAVYKIVPDGDFAAVKINKTGTDISVSIPPEVNGGITLNFTEVAKVPESDTDPEITAAEISVTDNREIFDNVADGIANMTVFETLSNGTIVTKVFSSKGPVVRINDGSLAVEGETNITLRFDPSRIPQGLNSTLLKILHFNGTHWEDVTLTANVTDNTVTAVVDSFSPFVVGWDSKFGIGGVTPIGERHRGGGGHSRPPEVIAEPPEQQVISNLTLAIGATSSGSINLAPLGSNDTIDVMLQNVTSTGYITVTEANSQLMNSYVNAGVPLAFQGSNFTILGPIYNLTADSELAFSGYTEVSMPYNQSVIGGLSGANFTEGAVRLLYHDGDAWHDATTGIDETVNKVTGIVQSLVSPILITAAVVHDGTFGPAYFDSNPHDKVTLETAGLSRDVTIGGVDPLAGSTQCSLDETGQGGCVITLAGSIQNFQRTNQTYTIIVQTTDANRIVYSIEIFSGLLERGERKDIEMTWSLNSLDVSARYTVQVFVLNGLSEDTSLIGEELRFDLDL